MERFHRSAERAGDGDTDDHGYQDDEAQLAEFAGTRAGVEAFVEPGPAVTDATVLLVAASGEWTRRRTPGAQAAHQLARRLGIPAYDASVVGYPARLRSRPAPAPVPTVNTYIDFSGERDRCSGSPD